MARSSTARRRAVAARATGRCEYCRCPESYVGSSFCIDHIHPRAAGGLTTPENLAFACPGCNAFKSDQVAGLDPATGKMTRLFHPRLDLWSEHFRWSEDSLDMLPVTSVARATVARLRLNRPALRNLRHALRSVGVHPPE